MEELQKHNRIGMILSHFPTYSETFIVNQIIALKNLGYEVTVFAKLLKPLSKSSQAGIIKENNLLDDAITFIPEIPKNKILKFLSALRLLLLNPTMLQVFSRSISKSSFGTLGASWKLWFQAVHFNKLPKQDIYHAQFGENGLHLSRMKQLGVLKGAFIVTFHGYDAHPVNTTIAILQLKYKTMFNLAKNITVNTNYLKQKLLELGCPDNKIQIIPAGIDTDFHTLKEYIPSKTFKIITVGRLIELKGQIYGVKAIHKLLELGLNVEYTIVGDGPEYSNLESQITVLGIQASVKLLNYKSQEEIKMLLRESDVFLMTSITDSNNRAEAQGLVVVEAQATGLPVVGFNSGGISSVILENTTGFLVPEKDIDALAHKLKIILQDYKLQEKFGLAARNFVKSNFDTNVLAQKISNLYKHINTQE